MIEYYVEKLGVAVGYTFLAFMCLLLAARLAALVCWIGAWFI